MQGEQQVYHLKVDASGRIVLPAEARERNHIAEGDTVVVVADAQGLHIKTREKALAPAAPALRVTEWPLPLRLSERPWLTWSSAVTGMLPEQPKT